MREKLQNTQQHKLHSVKSMPRKINFMDCMFQNIVEALEWD